MIKGEPTNNIAARNCTSDDLACQRNAPTNTPAVLLRMREDHAGKTKIFVILQNDMLAINNTTSVTMVLNAAAM